MPSSKPMLPGKYPAHWESAASFLAVVWERGDLQEVVLERGLTPQRVNTLHTKARAMRVSMQQNPAWGELLNRFAKSGAMGFYVTRDLFTRDLVMKVKPVLDLDKLLENFDGE